LNVVKGLLRLSTAWIGTMPNTLGVAMNLAHSVKRNSMHLSLNIKDTATAFFRICRPHGMVAD